MKYDVLVLPSAEKELAAIPARDLARILKRIELLVENPRPQGVQKLKGERPVSSTTGRVSDTLSNR